MCSQAHTQPANSRQQHYTTTNHVAACPPARPWCPALWPAGRVGHVPASVLPCVVRMRAALRWRLCSSWATWFPLLSRPFRLRAAAVTEDVATAPTSTEKFAGSGGREAPAGAAAPRAGSTAMASARRRMCSRKKVGGWELGRGRSGPGRSRIRAVVVGCVVRRLSDSLHRNRGLCLKGVTPVRRVGSHWGGCGVLPLPRPRRGGGKEGGRR